MRDYGEEPCAARAAAPNHLAHFDVLITYNGKSYDQPLLETRYRMARARRPSTAWRTWTCCTARAACGNCVWKAAGWWTWRTASWAWSAKATCPAK